jgi:hypothetical protein
VETISQAKRNSFDLESILNAGRTFKKGLDNIVLLDTTNSYGLFLYFGGF